MNKPVLTLLLSGLILSGCASYKAVDAGKDVPVGDGVYVQPQVQWANAAGPTIDGTVWTIDGLGLNELRFMTGVTQGQPLLQITGVKNAELVHYQSNMLPDDVAELTVSTLQKMGYAQAHSSNLKPAAFGPVQGFRFDLAASRQGLDMKGMAVGAQRAGKLDMILFLAPTEYYFDQYKMTVQRIFDSISIQPGK